MLACKFNSALVGTKRTNERVCTAAT